MTSPQIRFEIAGIEMRIARCEFLLSLEKSHPDRFAGLLSFANSNGARSTADGVTSFRSEQEDALLRAQAELYRLPSPGAERQN
jgi:hypothetical protein